MDLDVATQKLLNAGSSKGVVQLLDTRRQPHPTLASQLNVDLNEPPDETDDGVDDTDTFQDLDLQLLPNCDPGLQRDVQAAQRKLQALMLQVSARPNCKAAFKAKKLDLQKRRLQTRLQEL